MKKTSLRLVFFKHYEQSTSKISAEDSRLLLHADKKTAIWINFYQQPLHYLPSVCHCSINQYPTP